LPASIHRRWSSPKPPSELLALLGSHTEPLDGGFKLTYRLSGAGVVVRTLEAPETERRLFGKLSDHQFSVAVVPVPTDVTPFHPIIRATVEPSASGGSTIQAELAHHPNARTFAPVYTFGAVTLGVGSWVGAQGRPELMFGGLAMAAMFAVFPTLQSRARFQQSVRRSEAVLLECLSLQADA